MRDGWRAEPANGDTALCPAPVDIPLLFGGKSKATIRRATTVGDGWVAGALRDYPTQSKFADAIRDGWRRADRAGHPQIHASANFALGDDDVAKAGRDHLARYCGFVPEYAQLNVDDMLTSA
jgi:alkanesulfonate monooxygenase SsuD/methylene tetrahydromethanopterin reductase-like flavin-dependent oxidoreductase (luciferase family)